MFSELFDVYLTAPFVSGSILIITYQLIISAVHKKKSKP